MERIVEKSELQIRLEEETPNFLNEYKELILSVIEDYIYIPDFMWRNDYIYDSFENNLKSENIWSEVLEEVICIKRIIRDIADWKYIQKLEII